MMAFLMESPFQSTAAILRKINGDTFLQPGDTVYFVGDYAADDYNPDFRYDNNPMDPYLWRSSSAGVKINNLHGTPAAPITFKAWDDTTTVHADDYAGFIIQNSSHIRIIGFEVKGAVDHISGDVASALQFLYRVEHHRTKATPARTTTISQAPMAHMTTFIVFHTAARLSMSKTITQHLAH